LNRLFWKIYIPVALCLLITILVAGFLAFRAVPQAMRDYQRRTLENFRNVLLTQPHPLTEARAIFLADSLGVHAEFIPIGPHHPLEGPSSVPRPGRVFLPAMPREFPFLVEVELMPPEHEQRRQRLYLLYILSLLAVEGIVLYLALLPLRRRMRKLERATSQIGQGRLGTRVETRRDGDLIDSLGGSFNSMAERIEQLVSSHQELLSSVAHELRTPLARIGLALEMVRESSDSDRASREEKLARMEKDLAALDRLVSELLEYNRLGRHDSALEITSVDLGQLAREVSDTESWGRDDEITLSITGSGFAKGDRRKLARAIGNLIRNACRHARSRVDVSISEARDMVVLAVGDDGPGIPQELRDRLGEPFVKGEGSGSGRTGLGLAIVFRIARLHGGSVSVGQSSAGGAEVALLLPLAGPGD
jgi:signal transduction histidine kinase